MSSRVSKVRFSKFDTSTYGLDIYDTDDNHLGVTFNSASGTIQIWYNDTSVRII